MAWCHSKLDELSVGERDVRPKGLAPNPFWFKKFLRCWDAAEAERGERRSLEKQDLIWIQMSSGMEGKKSSTEIRFPPDLSFPHPTVFLTSMVESNSRVRKKLYLPLYHSNLRRIGTTANAVTEAQESGVESDKWVCKLNIYNYWSVSYDQILKL